jgi:hypothetical protein
MQCTSKHYDFCNKSLCIMMSEVIKIDCNAMQKTGNFKIKSLFKSGYALSFLHTQNLEKPGTTTMPAKHALCA